MIVFFKPAIPDLFGHLGAAAKRYDNTVASSSFNDNIIIIIRRKKWEKWTGFY